MINLNHNYALLEDGTIEPIYRDENHTRIRNVFQEENGKYYFGLTRHTPVGDKFVQLEIKKTANSIGDLASVVIYIVGSFNGDVYIFTDKSEAIEKAEHTDTGRVEVYWLKNNDLRHLETLYKDENWGEGIEERED